MVWYLCIHSASSKKKVCSFFLCYDHYKGKKDIEIHAHIFEWLMIYCPLILEAGKTIRNKGEKKTVRLEKYFKRIEKKKREIKNYIFVII